MENNITTFFFKQVLLLLLMLFLRYLYEFLVIFIGFYHVPDLVHKTNCTLQCRKSIMKLNIKVEQRDLKKNQKFIQQYAGLVKERRKTNL